MQNNATNRTHSQKRVKDLRHQSDVIGQTFNTNNFYEGNQINMIKLKEQISIAKRKLLQDKDQDVKYMNQFNTQKQIMQPANLALQERTKRIATRADIERVKLNNPDTIKRLATELGDYKISKRNAQFREIKERKNDKNENLKLKKINTESSSNGPKHQRFSSVDPPSSRNTLSGNSVEIQFQKLILRDHQVQQFESKIISLWELYQSIVELMQSSSKSVLVNQKLVLNYIKKVTSREFEFVHYLSQILADSRIERSIKLSRVLQNFSVFQACLKSLPKKKTNPSSEIINYLGYSSSNVIFLIKILLLTHESSFPYSEHVNTIIFSISEFEIKSYKNQLRNIKDVLRRLEHNNQIIAMIKTRCGKKHGKYCQQFLTRTIKQVEKQKVAFYECANNIFQFLAFHIHFENLANNFQIISTPPSPFLSLTYPRTIIIEPWGVLAFRKNNKLVVRAHCGKFLAEISNNCNLIFWTELMPKDAQILTSLLPVKENVHWLYRYHCRQENYNVLKIVDLVGCDVKNTLIIDSNEEHFIFNQNIGILMPWTGEKKDIKLIPLSEILQEVFVASQKTNVEAEISKRKPQIDKLNNKKRINHKLLKSKIS